MQGGRCFREVCPLKAGRRGPMGWFGDGAAAVGWKGGTDARANAAWKPLATGNSPASLQSTSVSVAPYATDPPSTPVPRTR